MKNKTLAILILLCNLLMPSSFAIQTVKKNCNCKYCRNKMFIKKYRSIEFIKYESEDAYYATGTLKMLSDIFNELLDLLRKQKNNIELDSNQKEIYSKDIKLLTYSSYETGIRTRPYGRECAQDYFKGLVDFMFHPMYMLINPGSGLNFSWLTCYPSSKFSDMLDVFFEYLKSPQRSGYFNNDAWVCTNYLKKITRIKLEQVLKIEEFYNKYPNGPDNAMVVFENIIFMIKKFVFPNDLAIRHLDAVVKYAKSQKNSDVLLGKIKKIVRDNITCFASCVEEMAYVYSKIR